VASRLTERSLNSGKVKIKIAVSSGITVTGRVTEESGLWSMKTEIEGAIVMMSLV
jgi:hypothetical protein